MLFHICGFILCGTVRLESAVASWCLCSFSQGAPGSLPQVQYGPSGTRTVSVGPFLGKGPIKRKQMFNLGCCYPLQCFSYVCYTNCEKGSD